MDMTSSKFSNRVQFNENVNIKFDTAPWTMLVGFQGSGTQNSQPYHQDLMKNIIYIPNQEGYKLFNSFVFLKTVASMPLDNWFPGVNLWHVYVYMCTKCMYARVLKLRASLMVGGWVGGWVGVGNITWTSLPRRRQMDCKEK